MPVIANGGYYGAPGVTAAGAYGSTPADMLHSLRNNGWSDQQIMDAYGANDPMVRIMQLENRWNQAQPGADGYRYQYPTRATTPARRPVTQPAAQQTAQPAAQQTAQLAAQQTAQPAAQQTAQPAAQQTAQPAVQPSLTDMDALSNRVSQEVSQDWAQRQAQQRNPVGSYGNSPLAARMARQRADNVLPPLNPVQQLSLERAVADPYQSLSDFGNFAPSYTSTADDYYAPQTGAGIRIRPWTNPLTYGGSLNMPSTQDGPSLVDSSPQYGSLYMYTGPFSGPRRNDFSATNLGQSVYNSLAQYR